MINEKFMNILRYSDGDNKNEGNCIGDVLRTLLLNPTIKSFFEKYGISFNDFTNSCVSAKKVETFIEKYKNTNTLVGPIEFFEFLISDSSDNVLLDCIKNDSKMIVPEGSSPVEIFSLGLREFIEEVHNITNIPHVRNLTHHVLNDKSYTNIKGRDDILESLHTQLNVELKSNVALTGIGGVGKTAIVEEYAFRHKDEVTIYELKTSEITSLGPAGEAKLTQIIEMLSSLNGRQILFIDEFHLLCKSENKLIEVLKPVLSRKHEFQTIVATTSREMRQFVESDEALQRRFFNIPVPELKGDILLEILSDWVDTLEGLKDVKFNKDFIPFIIDKMTVERQKVSPDKEKDIIDGVFAKAFISGEKEVTKEMIAEVLSSRLNVPVKQLLGDMMDTLKGLYDELSANIIGQDAAIHDVCKVLKSNFIRKRNNKPLGSFLFVGPTSVGKSELAKQIAEKLFGSRDNLLVYDCATMSEKYSVSSLLGSPHGYIGSENGGRLVNEVRQKPYSVVLFDEFEKADSSVHNVFLGILDSGYVTDKTGAIADFTNCVIIFTSNEGASYIDGSTESSVSSSFGFKNKLSEKKVHDEQKLNAKKRVKDYINASKDGLTAEFISRINDTIVFNNLTIKDIRKIIEIQLNGLKESFKESFNLDLEIEDSVVDFVLALSDKNVRRVENVIKNHLYEILDNGIIEGQIKDGDGVCLWYENECINMTPLSKEELLNMRSNSSSKDTEVAIDENNV